MRGTQGLALLSYQRLALLIGDERKSRSLRIVNVLGAVSFHVSTPNDGSPSEEDMDRKSLGFCAECLLQLVSDSQRNAPWIHCF